MANTLTEKDIEDNTYFLIRASEKGDINEVERLIPISNPQAHNSKALWISALHGYIDIVKILLPFSDPKAKDSLALQMAALRGHVDIVKLLIPVTDPTAENSDALRFAADKQHIECVKLLIPVSNCNDVLEQMNKYLMDTTFFQQCVDEYEAMLQKDRLIKILKNTGGHTNTIKRKI